MLVIKVLVGYKHKSQNRWHEKIVCTDNLFLQHYTFFHFHANMGYTAAT